MHRGMHSTSTLPTLRTCAATAAAQTPRPLAAGGDKGTGRHISHAVRVSLLRRLLWRLLRLLCRLLHVLRLLLRLQRQQRLRALLWVHHRLLRLHRLLLPHMRRLALVLLPLLLGIRVRLLQ